MNITDIYLNLLDKERNIYETAELFEQNRKEISEYIQYLASPENPDYYIEQKDNELVCSNTNKKYTINNNVVNFTDNSSKNQDWEKLNSQFLNYHKSLTVYTLLNSMPFINFLSIDSGLGEIKNMKVVDVGGGTGHTFSSFFQYPETIEYFLVDPNLRLLHDQFIRVYPKLLSLKMAHILAYAEKLPFKNNFADLVISLSAIDHLENYEKFISESYRILKIKGKIFITSHLDIPLSEKEIKKDKKLFLPYFFERLSRFLYYRHFSVQKDDHTLHLENYDIILNKLKETGFKIEKHKTFKRYFYIIAEK